MPKQMAERIIDYPHAPAVGRASVYPSGSSGATLLADHSHDGTLGSGGVHNHDDRYYTESEVDGLVAGLRLLSWMGL